MAIKLDAEEAVKDLDLLWQQIVEEEETVIISRPGREDIALISAGELASLQETAYLLASPANGLRLLTALRDAREGKGTPMTIDELRREMGLDEDLPD